MGKLEEIDHQQAEKLLQETDFDNRLVGVAMHASSGNEQKSLYSLEEVGRFIYADESESLLQKGHSSITYLDMKELVEWIKNVYEDYELAELLEKELGETTNKIEQLKVASKRIQERLKQCYEVLENN